MSLKLNRTRPAYLRATAAGFTFGELQVDRIREPWERQERERRYTRAMWAAAEGWPLPL